MKQTIVRKELVMVYLLILLGSFVGAIAYPLFYTTNNIAPGGLTGLAAVLNYLFQVPIGITSLLMNIPLFIIGWRTMGRTFVVRSLIATIFFSILIDIIPVPALTKDPLLGALFGGVLEGCGLGLILRGGATSGGSDMVARMIHNRFQHITVGAIFFVINACVVLLAGIYIKIEYALYAFIAIYVCSLVMDKVMTGLNPAKACYIISAKHDKVMYRLIHEMERGVTLLHGEGGYSGEARPVLLCIISAQEVARVKSIVKAEDKNAFVFINDTHEVLGEGFQRLDD